MDNIVEFDKKYRETYIRYKDKDAVRICKLLVCQNEDAEGTMGTLFLHSKTGSWSVPYPKGLDSLLLDSPESGLFNYNRHALFLFKTPARQWRRGLCSDNHEIYNPFRRILETVYRPMWNASSIEAMFDKNYITNPEKALEMLKTQYSVALSRNLMFSNSPTKDTSPLVWYHTTPCGRVVNNKIVVHDPLLHQEVKDELVKLGAGNWIS